MKLLNAIEVVQALEFGERVQMLVGDEWRNLNPALITLEQLIRSDTKYRRAPENITVVGVSFPKAESREPKFGSIYFLPIMDNHPFFMKQTWNDSDVDNVFLKRGVVHLTRDAAIQHAKALIKLSGGLCDE